MEIADSDPPEPAPPTADGGPSTICRSVGWEDAVGSVLDHAGLGDASPTTTATGRGCRTTTAIDGQKVEVRLELLGADALDDVVAARIALGDDTSALMGFEELGLVVADGHVSSSLWHADLGRLEEHRWIQVDDDEAFHLLVVIEPRSAPDPPGWTDVVTELESDVAPLVADYAERPPTPQPAPVVAALGSVIDSVAAGEPLGDTATAAGAEAIAFEYAFPENLASIATHREDIVCGEGPDGMECQVTALDAVYRFRFVEQGDRWLLDDFGIER